MFVLLFAFVFGGAIQTGPVDYIDFLLPGILAQSVLFGSTQTGVGLAVDVTSDDRSLPRAAHGAVTLYEVVEYWPHHADVFVAGLMLAVEARRGYSRLWWWPICNALRDGADLYRRFC